MGCSPSSLITWGYLKGKSEIKQKIWDTELQHHLTSIAKYHYVRNKKLELSNYVANPFIPKYRIAFTLAYSHLPYQKGGTIIFCFIRVYAPVLLRKLPCCPFYDLRYTFIQAILHNIPGRWVEWYPSFLLADLEPQT